MKNMKTRNAVEARIAELAAANDGRITPRLVVEDARDPESALHACFEWDDSVAGEKYRIMQARALIRSVPLVIKENRVTIRSVAYVRDPESPPRDQGYVEVMKIKSDRDAAVEVLTSELRRSEAGFIRSRHLAVVLGMEEEVDEILERLRGVLLRVAA